MLNLIVAIANNNVIGKDNKLPWHYSEDLKYFKKVTNDKTVLMGVNTFNSIISYLGKPLPNRKSVVASLEPFMYDGVEVTNDVLSYIEESKEDIFVIGGKNIYELLLPYCDRLYITHIDKDYDGNVYFPYINYDDYKIIECKKHNELRFCVYERS